MHKAWHRRDDVDIQYVLRKERRRGPASIEDSVDPLIQRLEDYIEKQEGGLITTIKKDTDKTMDNNYENMKKNDSMWVLND